MSLARIGWTFALGCLLIACAQQPSPPAKSGIEKIEHIIVIYFENRSFDNLYGLFPGADGIANATPAQSTQVDYDDYRDVDGIKFPFEFVFSWLDGRDGFNVTEVKTNVPIDPNVFGRPRQATRR